MKQVFDQFTVDAKKKVNKKAQCEWDINNIDTFSVNLIKYTLTR